MPLYFEQATTQHQQFVAALKKNPNDLHALHSLGMLLSQLGDAVKGLQLLSQAENQAPDSSAERHFAMAKCHRRLQHAELSLHHAQSAIRLDSNESQYHVLLGDLNTDMGQLDEARIEYEHAIGLNGNETGAFFGLALLCSHGYYVFSSAQKKRLTALANNNALTIPEQSQVHFALAKILHREKDYANAFQHFQAANKLSKQAHAKDLTYDEQAAQTTLNKTKAIFSKPLLNRFQRYGNPSKLPIFILGMPRTGTTLLEKILASHPQIQAHGELMHIKNIARMNFAKVTTKSYPDLIAELPTSIIPAAANHYLSKVTTQAQRYRRIVDKMPTNYEMLGVIQILFPQAFVIHTQRDPMDTLWSCYQQPISAKYTNSFTDLVAKYRQYREYMDFWKQQLSIKILDLHYEDLIHDFPKKARQVIDFVELDWDSACLSFQGTDTGTTTASRLQVRKPIYSSSINAWKRYESQLAPLREQLEDYY